MNSLNNTLITKRYFQSIVFLLVIYFGQVFPYLHLHHHHDDDNLNYKLSTHPLDLDFETDSHPHSHNHDQDESSHKNDHDHSYDNTIEWQVQRIQNYKSVENSSAVYLRADIDNSPSKYEYLDIDSEYSPNSALFHNSKITRGPPLLT